MISCNDAFRRVREFSLIFRLDVRLPGTAQLAAFTLVSEWNLGRFK